MPKPNTKDVSVAYREGKLLEKDNHGRSVVWKHFVLLYSKETQKYEGFVMCKNCKSFFKHDIMQSGTSRLSIHMAKCLNQPTESSSSRTEGQQRVTSYFNKELALSKNVKNELTEACVNFVAQDCRPLKTIEGQGLVGLLQKFIGIGARYGNVSASSILPSRATVKRKLCDQADEMKFKLAKQVNSFIQQHGMIGLTTDMWTDIKQRSFVSLTVHYVVEGNIVVRVFSVYEFLHQQKTGCNIRDSLEKLCGMLGICLQTLMQRCCFVTDQGSNIKVALENFLRVPCACHMLSTCVKHILQLESLSHCVLPVDEGDASIVKHLNVIRTTVQATKSLVGYLKRSGLNNQISKSTKQANETRWNSLLVMLESVVGAKDELKIVLESRQQEERLSCIDFTVLQILIDFLKPFQDSTKALEGDLTPTLHHVCLWYAKLKELMRPSVSDLPLLQFLKQRGLAALQEKFEIKIFHKAALFLNPKFKSLCPFNDFERREVHDFIEGLINHLPTASDEYGASASIDHSYMCPPKKTAKKSSIDDEFSHWQENTVISNLNEVECYAKSSFEEKFVQSFIDAEKGFNPLKFWLSDQITSQFPSLSRLAIGILSIPASSASSERTFSLAGNTITKKRSQLSSSTVDALIVMNSGLRSKSTCERYPEVCDS